MSENDPTKDIGEKYDTRPTIETVLQMLVVMREEMRAGFASMERRMDAFDVRLDRIESVVHETKSGFHTLRADFNELRNTLKEHFPLVK